MTRRKMTIAFSALALLALASLGVGYGLWSKTLYVNGTIGTGNVDAIWTAVGCFDLEELKDVGNTTGWIDPEDPQILHFLIENGYPCYTGDCEVEFTYVGTIPVHVEAIRFLPGPELTNCVVDQSPTTGSFVATCDQLTVTWANGLCAQLHEGDFLGSSLRVHVEQEAEQCSMYTFSVEVQLNQFNESNCPVFPPSIDL
jgi:hypothetical protein